MTFLSLCNTFDECQNEGIHLLVVPSQFAASLHSFAAKYNLKIDINVYIVFFFFLLCVEIALKMIRNSHNFLVVFILSII